jgi:putative addiction module CopG family antidote
MNVSLPPQLRKFVESKVRAGQYPNASDMVRSALEALRAQESLTPADVAELRRAAMIGADQLDRGEVADFTAKDIQAMGRRILAARRYGDAAKPRRRRRHDAAA